MSSVSAQVNMEELLRTAIFDRGQVAFTNSNGTHLLLEGGRKIKLIDKVGNISEAGHQYPEVSAC